jgi:broad specificity phosphatase PhoE
LSGSKTKNEPINTEGINQIKCLVPCLHQYNPDTIYCSPLLRAVQSAKILVDTFRVQPIFLNDLREIDFGDWEGRNLDKLSQIFPDEYNKWIHSLQTFTPPNGESVKHLYLRIETTLETILSTTITFSDSVFKSPKINITLPCIFEAFFLSNIVARALRDTNTSATSKANVTV